MATSMCVEPNNTLASFSSPIISGVLVTESACDGSILVYSMCSRSEVPGMAETTVPRGTGMGAGMLKLSTGAVWLH